MKSSLDVFETATSFLLFIFPSKSLINSTSLTSFVTSIAILDHLTILYDQEILN